MGGIEESQESRLGRDELVQVVGRVLELSTGVEQPEVVVVAGQGDRAIAVAGLAPDAVGIPHEIGGIVFSVVATLVGRQQFAQFFGQFAAVQIALRETSASHSTHSSFPTPLG